MWAKIRSKLYFVRESNRLYCELIHDTLKTYAMYEFPEMPTQENQDEKTAETLAKVLAEQLEFKEKSAMELDYSKIKIAEDKRVVKQVVAVFYSWSKLLLIRKQKERCEAALVWARKTYADACDCDAKSVIFSAKLDSVLSGIFSGDLDANSEQVYDI